MELLVLEYRFIGIQNFTFSVYVSSYLQSFCNWNKRVSTKFYKKTTIFLLKPILSSSIKSLTITCSVFQDDFYMKFVY